MKLLRTTLAGGIAVAAAMILAACTTSGPSGPPAGSLAPKGVEGSWIDAQGTGLSTLSAGSFRTVATDTGQKLSEGSYIVTGAASVEITGTSLIRQSPISFNCLLVSTSQLNCTSAAGQNFVLTRRT
jgi:hypothetical protein